MVKRGSSKTSKTTADSIGQAPSNSNPKPTISAKERRQQRAEALTQAKQVISSALTAMDSRLLSSMNLLIQDRETLDPNRGCNYLSWMVMDER